MRNILENLKEEMNGIVNNEEQLQILNESNLKQERMLEVYDKQVDTLLQQLQQERKRMNQEKSYIEQLRRQYEEDLRRRETIRPNTIPKVLLLICGVTFGCSCLYYIWIAFGTHHSDNLQYAVWNALVTLVAVLAYEREMMKNNKQ